MFSIPFWELGTERRLNPDTYRLLLTDPAPPPSLPPPSSPPDLQLPRLPPPLPICSLDTGRLNPETYRLFDKVEKHYNIRIEYTFPDAQETIELVGLGTALAAVVPWAGPPLRGPSTCGPPSGRP